MRNVECGMWKEKKRTDNKEDLGCRFDGGSGFDSAELVAGQPRFAISPTVQIAARKPLPPNILLETTAK